jgi:acyl-CoA synthetase (NDP forming)
LFWEAVADVPDISKLLDAKSVAVVGASPDATRLRGILFDVLTRGDYAGRIYPVTPSHDEVMGHKAYKTVADIPETVDLAILAIPAGAVVSELERCGAAGIKAAAIVTSGFAEQAGSEGEAMQRDLSAVIEKYDMAVTGPNSLGFINFAAGLAPTFSPAIARASLPLIPEWHDEGGRVAVIAQSGAIGFGIYDRGRLREIPFRYVITTGNEAGLRAFDIVDYLLDEGETEVFALFLEDIRDGDQFRRVAAKALAAGKPILAVKIGRSQAAQESAASHTGAMVGSDRVNRTVMEAYGVTICEDLDQLVDYTAAFYHNRTKLPRGRRIGISAGTGGGGGWIADQCDAFGLEVPVLDAAARKAIDTILPEYGSSRNPVDGTAQAIGEIGNAALAHLTSQSTNIDATIMICSARAAYRFEKERDSFLQLGRDGAKPSVTWTYTWPTQETVAFFASAGVPLYTDTANAAGAMAALATYRETRDGFAAPLAQSEVNDTERQTLAVTIGDAGYEHAARTLLSAHGIGTVQGVLVDSAEAAAVAMRAISGRAVMKIQSPDILHKTEAGGVRLAIETPEAAAAAYEELVASAKAYNTAARIAGVLVEPMAPTGVELILGVQNDSSFGPTIMVGLGGIFTEIFEDTVLSLPVAGRDQAISLLKRLKGAPLLFGARGRPPADVVAAADLIVALSRFAVLASDKIDSIDLNPVIVHSEGHGLSVVDALIVPAGH